MKKNKTIKHLTYSAILAALIFLSTAYLAMPLPVLGYVHLGDGFILLAAAILPTPYAVGAAVIGAGAADIVSGYVIYLPATVIIKAITAMLVSSKDKKMISVRNLTALIPAVLVCCGGYYLYESLIYKSFVSPIASVPFNLVQSALGGIIFVLLGVLIDKNHGLRKIFKQNLQ
jgi:uncharacterized repeat protein (TIGR04002 family)